MKFSKTKISKFLNADYLKGKSRTVQMDYVEMELLRGDTEAKPVLHFFDCEKPMVLNRTNGKVIVSLYGDPMEGWSDRRITLFPTTCEVGGEIVSCVRIRPLNPDEEPLVAPLAPAAVAAAPVTPAAAVAPAVEAAPAGDIPF